ncbi:hypothetical protein EUGRSUZ_B01776 [Eucalyptus grandis]|uniref:Uncharacterized protein n=2 Tax=Eucalyptus grandis TaxID=71139 RepID=A0ACC3LS25_EUCGR|nr:hypothetical protein EUGRSUZ_B01776 [Eucalyptus grandis]
MACYCPSYIWVRVAVASDLARASHSSHDLVRVAGPAWKGPVTSLSLSLFSRMYIFVIFVTFFYVVSPHQYHMFIVGREQQLINKMPHILSIHLKLI